MTSIFTVEEARAFPYFGRIPLASAEEFPDEVIEATAETITGDFAQICDVAFVPTEVADAVLDGGGTHGPQTIVLPHSRVTAVSAAARREYGVAAWTELTTDELARLVVSASGVVHWIGGCWPRGVASVRLSYTHGYAAPPPAIKRAALVLAVNQLVNSNVSDRATQETNESGTFNLAVAGWRDQSFYGLPVVDSVLARYSERGPQVG